MVGKEEEGKEEKKGERERGKRKDKSTCISHPAPQSHVYVCILHVSLVSIEATGCLSLWNWRYRL